MAVPLNDHIEAWLLVTAAALVSDIPIADSDERAASTIIIHDHDGSPDWRYRLVGDPPTTVVIAKTYDYADDGFHHYVGSSMTLPVSREALREALRLAYLRGFEEACLTPVDVEASLAMVEMVNKRRDPDDERTLSFSREKAPLT